MVETQRLDVSQFDRAMLPHGDAGPEAVVVRPPSHTNPPTPGFAKDLQRPALCDAVISRNDSRRAQSASGELARIIKIADAVKCRDLEGGERKNAAGEQRAAAKRVPTNGCRLPRPQDFRYGSLGLQSRIADLIVFWIVDASAALRGDVSSAAGVIKVGSVDETKDAVKTSRHVTGANPPR